MATFQLDPAHSSVTFNVKHMMIAKVHGAFETVAGKLEYDRANPDKASAEAVIQAGSITTHQDQRDEHLRSPDFFDVGKFPELTFKSKKVSVHGDELKVVGDLTIKGVSKEIVLKAELPSDEQKDPYGNVKIGLSASAKINRKDFGLGWNAALETGGVLVGEDVNIQLDLQFAKQG